MQTCAHIKCFNYGGIVMEKSLYLKLDLNGKQCVVGILKVQAAFRYSFEYLSKNDGIEVSFDEVCYLPLTKAYQEWSGGLKPFQDLLLHPERPDAPKILKLLKMDNYDPWTYLERTQGKVPTSHFYFDTLDGGISVFIRDLPKS